MSAIQESLSMNEKEIDRSKQTIESLSTQQAQLQVNLEKVHCSYIMIFPVGIKLKAGGYYVQ